MSDHPSAGEFARVVDGCPCGGTSDCVGSIELVLSVDGEDWACDCPVCRRMFLGPIANVAGAPGDCYPLRWLRRVPPERQLLEEIEREAIPA